MGSGLSGPDSAANPEAACSLYVLVVACGHASAALPSPASPVRLAPVPARTALLPGHNALSGASDDRATGGCEFWGTSAASAMPGMQKAACAGLSLRRAPRTQSRRAARLGYRVGAGARSPAHVFVDHALVVHYKSASKKGSGFDADRLSSAAAQNGLTSVVCWRPAAWRRLAQASRDGPRSAPLGRFMLPGQTMIRHASHPGAVAAISFGMHGAATGGCLMTSASLPLSLAAGVTRAAPHAVNLAPVASPANKTLRTAASTQEYSAGNFINTSGRTCMARAITAPRASRLQQDWDLHQMISSWSDGILTTT